MLAVPLYSAAMLMPWQYTCHKCVVLQWGLLEGTFWLVLIFCAAEVHMQRNCWMFLWKDIQKKGRKLYTRCNYLRALNYMCVKYIYNQTELYPWPPNLNFKYWLCRLVNYFSVFPCLPFVKLCSCKWHHAVSLAVMESIHQHTIPRV